MEPDYWGVQPPLPFPVGSLGGASAHPALLAPPVPTLLLLCMSAFMGLNPIVHFRLHHTVSCTEKSPHACADSASAERVGQGEGWGHPQGDMHMVAATLGCEGPWLGLGGPPPTLIVWVRLKNTTFTL